LAAEQPDLVAEVERILEKKRAERAVMPEEYQTLSRFVQMVEQRQLEQREAGRAKRLKAMEKVRPNIPARAFEMPLEELELADDIVQALKAINNVGELMVRLQADEENLKATLDAANAGDDAMDAIKEAIDSLVLSQPEAPVQAAPSPAAPPETQAALAVAAPVEVPVVSGEEEEEEEEAPPAFVDEEPRPAPEPVAGRSPAAPVVRRPVPKPAEVEAVDYEPYVEPEDLEEEEEGPGAKKKKGGKKGKNRRRELIFDERRGEVVAKRKRKGGRARDWADFDE
jgi:hypothetical protein